MLHQMSVADQALDFEVDNVLDELLERCSLVVEREEEQEEDIFTIEDAFPAETAFNVSPTPALSDEDWSCAICLDEIPLADTAQIKGCEHKYCVCCILKWCSCSQHSEWRCPKCKANFTILNTYRCLDGSMCDHLCEESVILLLRARWFLGKSPLIHDPEDDSFPDYQEQFDEDYYDDEDYAAEDYFYENTRRSIVIGNRRYGQNGVISGGRSFARPIASSSPPQRHRASSGELSTSPSSATPSAKKVARQDKKDKKAAKEAEKRAKRSAKMKATDSTSGAGSSAGASGSGSSRPFNCSL